MIRSAYVVAAVLCAVAHAQDLVMIQTSDGGAVAAHVYGSGTRGVVLAHGGRFTKESWAEQANALAARGFRVVAFDFRGRGQSKGPAGRSPEEGRHLDVLAAVKYLRGTGASTVAVVGASMGGDHAAEAAEAEPDAIDRLVLLAAGAYTPLVRMKGRKLFLMSRDDVIGDNKPRLPAIRAQYERASEPKELILVNGSAHAQFLFATAEGKRVLAEIVRFLSAP
jgi:alpha-beta hydrolase superfamily lysophospholipase